MNAIWEFTNIAIWPVIHTNALLLLTKICEKSTKKLELDEFKFVCFGPFERHDQIKMSTFAHCSATCPRTFGPLDKQAQDRFFFSSCIFTQFFLLWLSEAR